MKQINLLKSYSDSFTENKNFRDHLEKINLDRTMPFKNQECYYLLDIKSQSVIKPTGFLPLMGYTDDDISMELLHKNMHSEDRLLFNRILELTLDHCMENCDIQNPFQLSITCRYRAKNRQYLHVLNQVTIAEMNKQGSPLKLLIELKDISFINTSTNVSWVFYSPYLDLDLFTEQVYEPYQNTFTSREIEVIREMAKGKTNKSIARILFISELTVATHRKNILRKANCHSVQELINHSKEKGIIRTKVS